MSNQYDAFINSNKGKVLGLIGYGKTWGCTRMMLRMRTGLTDRTVRNIIEKLREDGHLICNDQDGNGYYLPESDADVLRQYRRDCARAMSILKRLKAFRYEVRLMEQKEENKDQITVEEILMLMEGKI